MRIQPGKLLAAFAVSTSLSTYEVERAFAVEPATIAAAATLGAAIISATSKKSAVPLQISLAQLDISIAIHDRMDNVEASLANIMLSVAEFPKEMRKALEEDRDIQRSETVRGITTSIHRQLAIANIDKTDPAEDRLILDNLRALQNERTSLFDRTDVVVPTIIQAYLTEMAALRATKASPTALQYVSDEYKKRLSDSINSNRPGNLVWTLNHLINKQRADEKQLMDWFSQSVPRYNGDVPFASGQFFWFGHSLVRHETQYEDSVCNDIGPRETIIKVPCKKPYNAEILTHNRYWHRAVRTYQSPMDPSLYQLSIRPVGPVENGGRLDYPEHKHTNSDAEFEKPFMAVQQKIEGGVQVYNARAEAIEETLLAIRLVNMAQSAMENNVEVNPELLQAELESWERGIVSVNGEKAEQLDREASAAWLVSQMDAGRIEARKTIARALERINHAIQEDKAQKWKANAVTLLNIVAAAANFAQALEAEAAIARMEAAANVISSLPKDEQEMPEQSQAGNESGELIEVDQADNQGGVQQDKPLSEMHAVEKIYYVTAIDNELKQAKSGKFDERMVGRALEAFIILDSMSPTIGDKYFQENYKTTRQLIEELLVDYQLSDTPPEFLVNLLAVSLRPEVVANGSLTSVSTQVALRESIAASLAQQLSYLSFQPDIKTFVEVSYENALRCDKGCFRPGSP